MVIEPVEGRVLSGINANELLDAKDDQQHALDLDRLLYVRIIDIPIYLHTFHDCAAVYTHTPHTHTHVRTHTHTHTHHTHTAH